MGQEQAGVIFVLDFEAIEPGAGVLAEGVGAIYMHPLAAKGVNQYIVQIKRLLGFKEIVGPGDAKQKQGNPLTGLKHEHALHLTIAPPSRSSVASLPLAGQPRPAWSATEQVFYDLLYIKADVLT